MSAKIDTGDIVLHKPTGEEWLVAYVDGDHLAWCGWPSGLAKVSDCTVVAKASAEIRIELLKQLASMPCENGRSDHRRLHAQRVLKTECIP